MIGRVHQRLSRLKRNMVESTTAAATLDKSKFTRQEPVTLITCPVAEISALQKQFRDYIIVRPKVPNCRAIDGVKDKKAIVMEERLIRNPDFKKYAKEKSLGYEASEIPLHYENFSSQEILSQLLPKGVEIPGGFEAVGHVAHMNLHDNQLPFKSQIG